MSSPKSKRKQARFHMREPRAMQIVNNVAEEYSDNGLTDFATKAELCETINWLCVQHREQLQRKDEGLDRIVNLAAACRMYPALTPTKGSRV